MKLTEMAQLAKLLRRWLAEVDPEGELGGRTAEAERARRYRERKRDENRDASRTGSVTNGVTKRDENRDGVTAGRNPPLEPPKQNNLTDQKISSEKQSSFPIDGSSKTSQSASGARDEKRDANGVTNVTAPRVTERDADAVTGVTATVTATTKKSSRPRSTKTALPTDFKVSDAIDRMCLEEGLPDPHVVVRDFRDKALANGYRYIDWEAAFRAWMRSDLTKRGYPAQERPPEIFRHPDRERFIPRDDESFEDYLARKAQGA